MSDFKDRMIEAYERGECSYEGTYEYVREMDAERADDSRKSENPERSRNATEEERGRELRGERS